MLNVYLLPLYLPVVSGMSQTSQVFLTSTANKEQIKTFKGPRISQQPLYLVSVIMVATTDNLVFPFS